MYVKYFKLSVCILFCWLKILEIETEIQIKRGDEDVEASQIYTFYL